MTITNFIILKQIRAHKIFPRMKTKSVPLTLAQVRALQASRIDEREIERARVREEEHHRRIMEAEDRHRIIQTLQIRAMELHAAAIIPEDEDPLESIDPTPE